MVNYAKQRERLTDRSLCFVLYLVLLEVFHYPGDGAGCAVAGPTGYYGFITCYPVAVFVIGVINPCVSEGSTDTVGIPLLIHGDVKVGIIGLLHRLGCESDI